MKNLIRIVILTFFLVSTGCDDFLEQEPVDELINENVIQNADDVTVATLGIYNGFQSFGNLLFPQLNQLADHANSQLSNNEFVQNELLADSPSLGQVWNILYKVIHDVTFILGELAQLENVSETQKNAFIGELKFLRAYAYINLCQLYGDVPLVVSTNSDVNRTLPRTEVNEIFVSFVLPELLEANQLVPEAYGDITSTKTRATRAAVQTLLLNTYMLLEQWNEAENMANILISNPDYALEPSYEDLFRDSTFSEESIWQIYYDENDQSNLDNGHRTLIFYPPTTHIINAFESGDIRFNTALAELQPGVFIVNKFRDVVPGDDRPYIYRLAEIYLFRAEARAQQNNLTGALEDVNTIRNRSGLPDLSGSDRNTILLAIEQERHVELCFESKRWYDLLRTDRADTVLGALKPETWDPEIDKLLPIPLQELDNNPNITQNPGY